MKKISEEKITKTYKIKISTARILNEIKLMHPNVSVSASEIVDNAIRHYYETTKESGGFKE